MDVASERELAAMAANGFSQADTPAQQTIDPAFAYRPPKNHHSSAAQRVLGISELRDVIIEALLDIHRSRIAAVRDIAACAAVNTDWRRSVMGSLSIPRRIFHTAPERDECLFAEIDDFPLQDGEGYGHIPTIYTDDRLGQCLYVDRDTIKFNPVLDQVLVLSKLADSNFKHEYYRYHDGIYIYQNDLCYPYGGTSMIGDIEKARDTGCWNHDTTALTYLEASDLAEHKSTIERISSELMGWVDEHPVFADDFQPWTAADLVPPIFRNMFLCFPPVTRIRLYFKADDSHVLENDLCSQILTCEGGVKIGHLIMGLAAHHHRMRYTHTIDGCLCRLDRRYPPRFGGYDIDGWKFDDAHSIEVCNFDSFPDGILHHGSAVWKRWGDREEVSRELVGGDMWVDDVLDDVGAGWMVDMGRGVELEPM